MKRYLTHVLVLGVLAFCAVMTSCNSRFYAIKSAPWNAPSAKARVDNAIESERALTTSDAAKTNRKSLEGRRGREIQAELKYLKRMIDDVWIIERPTAKLAAKDQMRADLIVRDPDTQKFIPIPLKRSDVAATITGFSSEVTVAHRFHNPFTKTIEATYVFPLPHDSAVTDFVMTVGKRKIRGIIRERKEAQRIYEEARRQGYRAALMTQERPNVFTQKVANIEPGESIDVEIQYFNTLRHENGEYEFILPMVVGPRYNPEGLKNPIIPLAANAAPSLEAVSTHYLAPNQRSGRDVSVKVDVDAGVDIEKIHSPTHAITTTVDGAKATVHLKGGETIANRDLIVRFKLAGDATKHAVLANVTPGSDGHVSLMIMPPADLAALERVPREMIFVVDCSGSMSGAPMRKVKEAMVNCLKGMTPDDRFQIIKFSNNSSALGDEPIPATKRNVKKALAFVDDFGAGGGTRMMTGINAALNMPHESGSLRIISFMTDGFIGNEAQILNTIHMNLGESRIFAFGVGSSVNRYLIEGMAQVGNGAAAYVGLNRDSGKVVDLFYQRCARPALTNVAIDWGGLSVSEVYPKYLPDVFVGRPLTVVGKVASNTPTRGEVTVSGLVGGKPKTFRIPVDLKSAKVSGNALSAVWARAKLKEMSFLHQLEPSAESLQGMIDFSIKHKVLCGHTAYLAVDASKRISSPAEVTVPVPTPMPDGVEYEKTVNDLNESTDR